MSKHPPVKQTWVVRCQEIYKFHAEQLREDPEWTLEKTASLLNMSIGSVSQNIMIASWMRTHENQIRKFKYMRDALEFVRAKKKEMFYSS